tara:strand:- start:7833 stop:8459 length:627 start_codon:yes stop_codon:yes gene_type:complete
MVICVLQYDNRHQQFLENLMDKNKSICKNIQDFKYIRAKDDNTISQYWVKVKLTNQLLEQFDGILWLDSDAVIHNPKKLISLIQSTDTFLMSGDNPFSHFCAGVWFVRNNHIGRKITEEWLQLYYNKYHSFWWLDHNTNQWKSNMPFAIHPCYEQPAFIKHILPKYQITKVPWNILNNPNIPFFFDNSATLHFYGNFKNFIPIYLTFF